MGVHLTPLTRRTSDNHNRDSHAMGCIVPDSLSAAGTTGYIVALIQLGDSQRGGLDAGPDVLAPAKF